MDLRLIVVIVRRWAWLLILGLVLGSAAGYVTSTYQEPTYEASTKILVMRTPQNASDSYLTSLGDQQLARTYTQLVETQLVISAASQRLGYPVLQTQIAILQVRDTQLIQLTVNDKDPIRAAEIANMLVEVLIEQNDALLASRYAASESTLEAQIKQVEGQIATLQAEMSQISEQNLQAQREDAEQQIGELQSEIGLLQQEIDVLSPPATAGVTLEALSAADRTLLTEKQTRLDLLQSTLLLYQNIYLNLTVGATDSSEVNISQGRFDQLQSTMALYQQIYSNLISNRESIRLARLQNTANVLQVERAAAPELPLPTIPWAILGGVLGLTLAAILAFLLEYFNDTLKSPADVSRILNLPVIGFLAEIDDKTERPFVIDQPRSPIAEAFRSLRTNLEFAAVERPIETLLVTSVGLGEGKTTTSANLAIVIAQGGKRVVLLDADLRRPRIHSTFGLSNRTGLSEVFRGQVELEDAIQKTEVERLGVITSGSLPPNPAELLASAKMSAILKRLATLCDVIVLDSPPFLVADASVLAAKVDGVLMVIQPGRTNANAALAMLEQLRRGAARIVGVTLNRIPKRRAYYYGGYRYYYSPYYAYGRSYAVDGQDGASSNGRSPSRNGKGRFPGLFGRRRKVAESKR